MKVPFTVEEFLNVFARYNTAIWPLQIPLYLLGLAVLMAAAWRAKWGGRFVAGTLAFYWVWMGAIYHIVFFRPINPVAAVFGSLFIVEGALFAMAALRGSLSFGPPMGWRGILGAVFVAYALVVYPLIGALAGHAYPRAPLFGAAPCPTTIFTFGILLWTQTRVPIHLLIIPFLWGLLGFSAALSFGIAEDFGLLVAALAGTAVLAARGRGAARSSGGETR